ncbi:MAG TPA: hypothetical protein VD761_08750 [Solirubrobacterales bacterium]|nr:hypothetical protein [Solirubrobacterales bacterium]
MSESKGKGSNGRSREAEIGPRPSGPRKPGWGRRIEIVAALLSIIAIGFALGPKIEAAFEGEGEVLLEIGEVTISNPPSSYSSTGAGEIEQDPATEPTIVATVRNRGDETAWIEEARVTVVEAARLSICVNQGGGDVPQSKRYRISLPDFPSERRVEIRRDLHVEVQPGHGVRPVLSFEKESAGTTNLYAIRVQLVAAPGHQVIDAGRFVVGVPEPVSRSGQVLPESDRVLLSEATVPDEAVPTWCFRHNLDGMRRVIAEPGRRSDYVAALTRLQPAPAWKEYADQRPARVVIEDLFQSDNREAAIYALEAAVQTGEPEYEAALRQRVIDFLLRRAAEDLDDSPGGSVEDAQRVLSLQRSPVASRLLTRAKAEKRAQEERFEEEEEELGFG